MVMIFILTCLKAVNESRSFNIPVPRRPAVQGAEAQQALLLLGHAAKVDFVWKYSAVPSTAANSRNLYVAVELIELP